MDPKTYRLAYCREMEAEGRPWRIEMPTGECLYATKVVMEATSETVLEPGPGRYRGYLECTGVLHYDPQITRIGRREDG